MRGVKQTNIFRVIQTKLNQLVYENLHMITDLPTKRILKRYDSDRHFSEFYPQDGGGENQLEPDMERDYATVAVRTPPPSPSAQTLP